MSYIKLKKQYGAFDLVPCDDIVYVVGNESVTSGTSQGAAPFVQIVYGTTINSADGLDLLATKVILGNANSTTATTTAIATMQNAVNDAIVKAAQAEGLVVEVDFGGLLSDANYVPIVAGETFVKSAGPVDYPFT
mgnify:CR=1 FL=1|jgi:hypothetical protein|tara:strand:- start:23481 stop:23885 length:405 start_codon:yes stop_codon:yes gene_type:complete